ncbi:MAG: zinc-ribbon domain-containing protein [Kiritimatiellia bacterium]
MAMIKCPECGRELSESAPVCPGCGYPVKPPPVPKKSKGVGWAVGCAVAGVAVLVIVAIVGLLAAIAIPSFVKARGTA